MTNGYIRKMKAIYTPSGILMGGGGGGAKWALVVTGSVICDRYEIGQLELQQEQPVGR